MGLRYWSPTVMNLATNTNNFSDWVDHLANEKFAAERAETLKIIKNAVGNNRQDLSRPILEDLLDQGYTTVTWNSGNSTHGQCRELNNQKWDLVSFLSGLQHDAPIFERSHPGDKSCSVTVSGAGLPDVYVDSYGVTDAAGRPSTQKTQTTPTQPTQAPAQPAQPTVQAPTPDQTPTLPKIRYEIEQLKSNPDATELNYGLTPEEVENLDRALDETEKGSPQAQPKGFWKKVWDFLTRKVF